MRLLEFASAEDTLELWRVISDNTWAAVAQQAAAEARAQAERAAARKSSSKRSGKSMRKSSSSPALTIAPKLPSAKPLTPNAKPNVAQTGAANAGDTPAVANVAPVTNTSGTTNTGNNISATNARAVHAPAAVQHAAVNPIMPKASNGSKHVHNWQNNTANKKQASMNDTHSANSYGTQLAPTSARSTITRAVQ